MITGRRHIRASSSTSRSRAQVKDPTEPPYLVLRQEISLRRRPHRRGRRPMPGWRHRGRVSRRRRALLHTGLRTASWTPRPTLFFSGRRMSERWRRRPTRGSACGTPRGHDQRQREQNWSIGRADHGLELVSGSVPIRQGHLEHRLALLCVIECHSSRRHGWCE